MKILSLFTGIGGLDLALKAIPWLHAKVVCYCEIDQYCQQVLQWRMECGHIDRAPIWADVYSLSGRAVAEAAGGIDCITGGFPCQAFSIAGVRKHINDSRGDLFWEITRIAREAEEEQGYLPMLFLENVPGLLSVDGGNTFGDILGTLAEMGFDARWGVVGAHHAGAPHRRDRIWFLAYPRHGKGRNVISRTSKPYVREQDELPSEASRPGEGATTVAHAKHNGQHGSKK